MLHNPGEAQKLRRGLGVYTMPASVSDDRPTTQHFRALQRRPHSPIMAPAGAVYRTCGYLSPASFEFKGYWGAARPLPPPLSARPPFPYRRRYRLIFTSPPPSALRPTSLPPPPPHGRAFGRRPERGNRRRWSTTGLASLQAAGALQPEQGKKKDKKAAASASAYVARSDRRPTTGSSSETRRTRTRTRKRKRDDSQGDETFGSRGSSAEKSRRGQQRVARRMLLSISKSVNSSTSSANNSSKIGGGIRGFGTPEAGRGPEAGARATAGWRSTRH